MMTGWSMIVGFIMMKHILRRLFRALPFDLELRDRLFFLLEHVVFSIAGSYTVMYAPGPMRSWFHHPELCWTTAFLKHNHVFHLYYLAKVGSHVEDLLYVIFKVHSQYSSTDIQGDDCVLCLYESDIAYIMIYIV